jgi:hypothetical protein
MFEQLAETVPLPKKGPKSIPQGINRLRKRPFPEELRV